MNAHVERTLEDDRITGVVIGRVMSPGDGRPQIMLADLPDAPVVVALSTVRLTSEDVGAEVALLFENGDRHRPIVLGRIFRMVGPQTPAATLTIDGAPQEVDLSGEREVTLRCGKASITLTRDGKIILRGTYISSRSSGVNRIKGGSVQIN